MKTYLLLFLSFATLAQQKPNVDFIKVTAHLTPDAVEKAISGTAEYYFKVNKTVDTIRIDAKNITFYEVQVNSKSVNFKNNGKELLLFEGFKKGKNTLYVTYWAKPKQTLYFTGKDENLQIWTQGQGKYTSHWLPSFDDVNEKVIFNLSITFRNDFEVIANGVLANKTINSKGSHYTWSYEMKKPMSSYLVALAIGKFDKTQRISQSGVPLINYYKPNNASKYNTTYAFSDAIFNYLENEIGYRYPWNIYKQVPIHDFIYAGMENTSLTLFAQDYVVDEIGFNDGNYCNVNAHELAHQWFGNLVTAKSSTHHWLQEGFATYYALLAEREIFGENYFYNQLYKNAVLLKNASKNDTIPLMNEKASSLTFYQKGAWALHTIREEIGAKAFKKAIQRYLKKHQYKNVETDDFLNEIKRVSNFETKKFKKSWLESKGFNNDEAMTLLKKNNFISELFTIQSYRNKSFLEKQQLFIDVMKSDAYFPIKVEILNQVKKISFEDKKQLIVIAMQTNDVMVRNSVAQTLDSFPESFKTEYESLLEDPSYETKVIALENLCQNFPEQCSNYLLNIKETSQKNEALRIAYLQFALADSSINNVEKEKLYTELVSFTSNRFDSATRQQAMEVVMQLNVNDTIFLENLINATTHYKWRFSQYAKEKLKNLLKNETTKSQILQLENSLPENEKLQLKRLL